MGTSSHGQLSTIVEVITRCAPSSVLEVGTGRGKWGKLLREYLSEDASLVGIEGWAPNILPSHAENYTAMHVGDAREILPGLQTRFDLVMLVDVFEHFTREDGTTVLRECERLGRSVLISVPATWAPQGDIRGNEYERHRAQYEAKDFRRQGYQVWRIANHIIAYKGPTRIDLRGTFLKWALSTLAPGLVGAAIQVRSWLSGRTAPHAARTQTIA